MTDKLSITFTNINNKISMLPDPIDHDFVKYDRFITFCNDLNKESGFMNMAVRLTMSLTRILREYCQEKGNLTHVIVLHPDANTSRITADIEFISTQGE